MLECGDGLITDSETGTEVRAPAEGEAEAVERVLGSAFIRNPLVRLLFGSNPRLERLVRLNRWLTRTSHVHQLVAIREGRVAGVLKYADHPHCEPSGGNLWRFIGDTFSALRWRALPFLFFELLGGDHPEWHHRHLIIVGVDPAFHGQGVGSALIGRFLELADEDVVPTILETDTADALRLYERFGYRVRRKSGFRGFTVWYANRNVGG